MDEGTKRWMRLKQYKGKEEGGQRRRMAGWIDGFREIEVETPEVMSR